MTCDNARRRLKEKGVVRQRAKKLQLNTSYLMGVGSALKYIFITRYNTTACGGCHVTASEMDEAGPEDCLTHIDYWAQRIHENSESQTFTRVLDFVACAYNQARHGDSLLKYKELIREAVELHLLEVAKKDAQTPR